MADEEALAAAALRAESDTIMAQLDRLHELEGLKRDVPPNDPRFVAITLQVENAARALLDDALNETEHAADAFQADVRTPINRVPPGLSGLQIIAAWREAERKLSVLDPASPEADELRLVIDAYRRAYRAAFNGPE